MRANTRFLNSVPIRTVVVICLFIFIATAAHRSVLAFATTESTEAELATRFEKQVRTIVKEHCAECHSQELAEADIDLTDFKSLKDIQHNLIVWQKVAEMLDSNQMPPKDAKQPTESQRKELRGWLSELLTMEARRTAGDPGPVVLRRLNNAEYTYTLRDLTGVSELQPAKEFPADGAAGEGFTNAGNALNMSPALLAKYLDAGKEVASHAVLLPDGIRFSPSPTRRDWTEELLTGIRQLYARYSAKEGETQVNLQGIVFDTNGGGRLPVGQYLLATLEEREAIKSGEKSIEAVATTRGLSPKYLAMLWSELTRSEPSNSLLLDELKMQWTTAEPKDVALLTSFVDQWQKTLWRFSSVGHIGKVNGPKAWLEKNNPIVPRQEIRLKMPAAEAGKDVSIYLVARDAKDGNENDFAVWEQPRLVAPGRADLLLKDVRRVASRLYLVRDEIFRDAAKCLAIADEVSNLGDAINTASLAEKHKVPATSLQAWLDYMGIGTLGSVKINAPLTRPQASSAGYGFVQGWVADDALSVVANSSDQAVRIPGNMKPHSVAVHPSPSRQVAVGWQCPETTALQIEGFVQHAHPECGNGVAWTLELRKGTTRQRLAVGTSQGARGEKFGPFNNIAVRQGEIVALVISPRDGNHSCDLTAIELTLKNEKHSWNLANDISPNILAGNPHADQFGNKQVWHFYSEPTQGSTDHVIPQNSLLARWQAASNSKERERLAGELQTLLSTDSNASNTIAPDVALLQQLRSLSGPLLAAAMKSLVAENSSSNAASNYGLDESLFGKHPQGGAIDSGSLCVKAPTYIEVKLPADLVAGSELVTSGSIHPDAGEQGSVQFAVLTEKPAELAARSIVLSTPIVVADASPARERLTTAFDDFRRLFPGALCYTKIVPVDEVVTLTLYYREDEMLQRLMLNDEEIKQLDKLWHELHFVSQDAFMSVDAYEQLWQYATQDSDPTAFEPLHKPLLKRAEEFRAELIAAEPAQINAVMNFADLAYRRRLRSGEREELQKLYTELRADELPHEAALRMLIARVLISPAFLYRAESGNLKVGPQGEIPSRPITDLELATRLSYFLWSTIPDERLRMLAEQGRLHEPEVLVAETRRMLKDERIRRLATEFTCQWIQIYDFDAHDEKSETVFPTFDELRGSMYEEAIRYFADMYQSDRSVLELIDSDHTFVNSALAAHYGVDVGVGADWQRVGGVRSKGRGGILGMAATLSKQAGASRTSPILRGNWISEVLIGEKLPKPPKNVPILPDTVPGGLTERQLIERHSADPACAKCHARIDPFGFSLENFDGIGRWRSGPEINSVTALDDGTELAGYEGIKSYLMNQRRRDFVRQFCKKSLGYALGRSVQLSDEPLLAEMQERLESNNYRISSVIESIVISPQFQKVRVE